MTAAAQTAEARRGLSALRQRIDFAATAALETGMRASEASAQATTLFRDRSGDTRQSIHTTMRGGRRGFVSAGGASTFLQSGTAPHRIVASGRALRFVVGGAAVFRRAVNHPGTAPRPFMSEARDVGEIAAHEAAHQYVGALLVR